MYTALLQLNVTPTMCALMAYNVNTHILSEKNIFISNPNYIMRRKHRILGKLDKNYISRFAAQHCLKHLCFLKENTARSCQQSFYRQREVTAVFVF